MFTNNFLMQAKKFNIDDILEICGDCPIVNINFKQITLTTKKNLIMLALIWIKRLLTLGVEGKDFQPNFSKITFFKLSPADKENVSLFNSLNISKIFNTYIYKFQKN